jgi:hypothetical protein
MAHSQESVSSSVYDIGTKIGYNTLTYSEEEDRRDPDHGRLTLDGMSRIGDWKCLDLVWENSAEPRPPAVSIVPGRIAMSDAAIVSIDPACFENVELLPLNVCGERWWLLNVMTIADAVILDDKNSEWMIDSITKARLALIEPAMRRNSIPSACLFKIPQIKTTAIFAADRPGLPSFRQMVQAANITGLAFNPVKLTG